MRRSSICASRRTSRRAAFRTVQYVSPQVWAWRQGRVRTIGRAVDLVLCLLPFEKQFYDAHRVRAEFVGHPLADQIPLQLDAGAARAALGLRADGTLRRAAAGQPAAARSSRLSPDFAATVAWLRERRPAAAIHRRDGQRAARARCSRRALAARAACATACTLVDGHAQEVMAASDVVLLASGTATLEATLVKRPMVVAYRLGALTSFLLKHLKLFKAPFFAQPNLLAGRQVVPEYLQRRRARRRARSRGARATGACRSRSARANFRRRSTRRCAATRARARRTRSSSCCKRSMRARCESTASDDSAQLAFNLAARRLARRRR